MIPPFMLLQESGMFVLLVAEMSWPPFPFPFVCVVCIFTEGWKFDRVNEVAGNTATTWSTILSWSEKSSVLTTFLPEVASVNVIYEASKSLLAWATVVLIDIQSLFGETTLGKRLLLVAHSLKTALVCEEGSRNDLIWIRWHQVVNFRLEIQNVAHLILVEELSVVFARRIANTEELGLKALKIICGQGKMQCDRLCVICRTIAQKSSRRTLAFVL